MFKSFYDKLTSTRASAMYILIFAIAIGAATFIEKDTGTELYLANNAADKDLHLRARLLCILHFWVFEYSYQCSNLQ